MKNIHLVYTDKPSRLFYLGSNLHLEQGQLISPKNYQHLYITSDEKIKEGDWLYNIQSNKIRKCFSIDRNRLVYTENDKKIILTTDADLIADGVQTIDDDFLQWFVKNPTCEYVDVENAGPGFPAGIYFINYLPDHFTQEITIPQEEPNEDKWDKLNKELDDALLVLREYIRANKEEVARDLEQMREWSNSNKQETLEEAAERLIFKTIGGNYGIMSSDENDQVDGYYNTYEEAYLTLKLKWQAERMYSEEDIENIWNEFVKELPPINNGASSDFLIYLKQFKKK